jgi:hypothetical protein
MHLASSQEAQPDSWFVIWTESRAEKQAEARIAALRCSGSTFTAQCVMNELPLLDIS